MGGKGASKADGKGNVIVSVRVRPDAAGNDSKTDGEWMVDSRKSLIAYRGKEGGDYYYGESFLLRPEPSGPRLTPLLQTTSLGRMMTTPESTTIAPNG